MNETMVEGVGQNASVLYLNCLAPKLFNHFIDRFVSGTSIDDLFEDLVIRRAEEALWVART